VTAPLGRSSSATYTALRSTAAPPIGVPGDVGEALDALYTGAVLLSVPLVDDVIQIGTAGTLTTGTIEVTKTPSAIRIRRTDGLPLQAAIVHHRDGRDAAGRLVFAEPVHSLRLRHLAPGCTSRTDRRSRSAHQDRRRLRPGEAA